MRRPYLTANESLTAAIAAFFVAALILVAASCAPASLDHWSVEGPTMANTHAVIDAVERVAPCDVTPWGGRIVVLDTYQNPPECERPRAGCYIGSNPPIIVVRHNPDAWFSALRHELCHAAQDTCNVPLYEVDAEACAVDALGLR